MWSNNTTRSILQRTTLKNINNTLAATIHRYVPLASITTVTPQCTCTRNGISSVTSMNRNIHSINNINRSSILSIRPSIRSLHTSTRHLLQLGGGPPSGNTEQGSQGSWVNPANVPPQEALNKYCHDLTAMAKEGKLDPVIGRDAEMRRTIEILSRRTKNNPVLLGEVNQ
jgi:ATP-dependent Clp protease ATP-binding subunit ClpA